MGHSEIQILNGNELIVQGALEAGFSLYTGYPGSPLADYFNILNSKAAELEKKGIKVAIANSEANAAAMASGAKQAGRDTLVAMKSMGLHVASDALSVGNFANPGTGGVVITVGDDPWSISTSTPADSRYLFKHLHIPFLEPSTPQELKDWMKIALEISKETSVYQGLLLTTYMAEGGGRVEVFSHAEVSSEKVELDPSTFDLSKNVMVPPNSLLADKAMINERFPKVYEVLKNKKLDKIFGNEESKVGFLSSGSIFETLKQVLEENEYLELYSLYKVGAPYPLIDELLLPFLQKLKTLIIVEEKRGFLEQEVIELCKRNDLDIKIFGKKFIIEDEELEGFLSYGGLNFEIISEKLTLLFSKLGVRPCEDSHHSEKLDIMLPKRLPTFCPGCPHRETLSLLKELRSDLEKKGVKLISHGDVGCYSLSFLPPFKEMHNLSAMGQGGALGAGLDLFSKNPSVVLMGDSTFFHSGITDISNSVQCGHDITYILLDNDNTAMTGHQMTPRTGVSVEGKIRPKQSIIKAVRSLGVNEALEVHPSDRYFYKNILSNIIKKSGVKVIISTKECGLTYHGRQKSYERSEVSKDHTIRKKNFYQINTEACEDCRACIDSTGCPGLTQVFDAYGTKVAIDPNICVADSYCTKIKACPSFELVEVSNYHPTKYKKLSKQTYDDLPEPDQIISLDDIKDGKSWRVVVTGVGGSGVTTISRVLAEASKTMQNRTDLNFKFVDQKGLAQRNGRVTGHLCIYEKSRSYGAITPLGTADLLLSPDLLDGSSAVEFLSKDGKAVFDDDFQVPLSILLDNEEDSKNISKKQLINELNNKLTNQLVLRSIKKSCEANFGKSVYASAAILGLSFQAGLIPFTEEELKNAFKNSIKKSELENNWCAFNLGRSLYINNFQSNKSKFDKNLYIKSIKMAFPFWKSSKEVLSRFSAGLKSLETSFPEVDSEYLARYLHDIIIYDLGKTLGDFIEMAESISISSNSEEIKNLALQVLAKTFWIKDEVMVSHLMVSPLKNKRDKDFYSQIGSKYKVKHINRPHFEVMGIKIEFDVNPKRWMLHLMRKRRFLRKVMPSWHKKERYIAQNIRNEVIKILKNSQVDKYQSLKKLDNIKGYREIRYLKANKFFPHI